MITVFYLWLTFPLFAFIIKKEGIIKGGSQNENSSDFFKLN